MIYYFKITYPDKNLNGVLFLCFTILRVINFIFLFNPWGPSWVICAKKKSRNRYFPQKISLFILIVEVFCRKAKLLGQINGGQLHVTSSVQADSPKSKKVMCLSWTYQSVPVNFGVLFSVCRGTGPLQALQLATLATWVHHSVRTPINNGPAGTYHVDRDRCGLFYRRGNRCISLRYWASTMGRSWGMYCRSLQLCKHE